MKEIGIQGNWVVLLMIYLQDKSRDYALWVSLGWKLLILVCVWKNFAKQESWIRDFTKILSKHLNATWHRSADNADCEFEHGKEDACRSAIVSCNYSKDVYWPYLAQFYRYRNHTKISCEYFAIKRCFRCRDILRI